MNDPRSQGRTSSGTEAADWYARLRAHDVSEMDAARFRAWLAGDPARRREFEDIDAFWEDLKTLENSPEILRARREISARRRRARPAHSRRPWAVAATVVLAAGAAAFIGFQSRANQYVTGVGEQRIVPLSDGSVVTLNTDTEIRLHYSAGRRDVELVRGQANFEVAKDPELPFIVQAAGGEVRAIGTVFDVYKAADKVTVTLIEGKVAVTPRAHRRGDHSAPGTGQRRGRRAIYLAAGEQLSYSTALDTVNRARVDVPRATAWRARKLDFSDTPLAEAIAEANRYSGEQIILEAPRLAGARISGTFEAGKNELFVEGLQHYFHLQVERADGHRIILREDQSVSPPGRVPALER